MNCRSYPLRPVANQFILDNLMDGHSLSRKVAAATDILSGRSSVVHGSERDPSDLETLTLPEFRYDQNVEYSRASLCWFIESFLRQNRHGICIVENVTASPGDKWIESDPGRLLIHDEEVYHLIEDPSENIGGVLDMADSQWILVGMMSIVPAGYTISNGNLLDQETIAVIAQSMKYLFVMAFDGAGFLIWERG